MKIKAFLFDLDGVIVDTAVFHYQAWRRMANSLGFDFDEEFNETLKGISRMDSLNAILNKGGVTLTDEEKNELAAQKNSWYIELVQQMTEKDILPGIKDFLTLAKSQGFKIGLGSASKNSAIILEKTNLMSFFDIIIDGNKVSKSKPDPEVFINGAASLNLNNEECVVFEDAYAGLEAAKAANMKSVGIGDENTLNNATVVYKNLLNIDPTALTILLDAN